MEKEVGALEGVASVKAELETGMVTVTGTDLDGAKINATIENAGYKCVADEKKKAVLTVEGMMCSHCQARVEKVLSEVPGVVSAAVDLEAKTATAVLSEDVAADVLRKAVEDAGYQVTAIN